MPAFVHAALVAEYAEDCKVSETPWEFWEYKGNGNLPWMSTDHPIVFHPASQYRRKPRTMFIGKVEVPEPMRKPPALESAYYVPHPIDETGYQRYYWSGDERSDFWFLRMGLVHATSEAARSHARAFLAMTSQRDA